MTPVASQKSNTDGFLSPIRKTSGFGDFSLLACQLTGGDASRLAVEKLIEGSGEDWSQMSRVKMMMENEEESEVANAISHLAKSGNLSRFSTNFDQNSNMSGLSVWDDSKHPLSSDGAESLKATASVSIMARVLGSTAEKANERSVPVVSAKGSMALAPSSSDPAGVETPKKPTTGFFAGGSMNALTSPHFKSPTAELREGTGLATNLSLPYSPTNSTVMGIFDDKAENENTFLKELNLSQNSNQEEFGNLVAAVADSDAPDQDGLLHQSNNHSLLLSNADDIMAVSALGALSSSPPYRPPPKLSQSSPQDVSGAKSSPKKERLSLFAKVVGGVNGKKQQLPSKRLEF
jgi:hypothetical protein